MKSTELKDKLCELISDDGSLKQTVKAELEKQCQK